MQMIEDIVISNLNASRRWDGLHKTKVTSLLSGIHVITGTYRKEDLPPDAAPDTFYIVPIMASTPVTPHDLLSEAKNVEANFGKAGLNFTTVIAVFENDSSITYLKIKEGINAEI